MFRIFIVSTLAGILILASWFQWRGKLNSSIDDVCLMPSGNIVAIGILENYQRYPLLSFSGWSRGVPKIHKRKARVYYYGLAEGNVVEKAVIDFPPSWDHYNRINLHIWDKDGGLYLATAGCPQSHQNCHEESYYHLSAQGGVTQVDVLPEATQEYMAQLHGQRAVTDYDVELNRLHVKIGRPGAWQHVLAYRDHTLIPLGK